jgi:hypothetical protein
VRILHVHHALYVTRLLSDALRELGHRADSVYFHRDAKAADLTWNSDYVLSPRSLALPQHAAFLAYAMARYDVFHFWARPYLVPALFGARRRPLPWDLALLRRSGKTIAFHSDGCYPMIRPSVWQESVDPEICHVCQTTQGDTYGFCSDGHTAHLNAAMERFADVRFGMGMGLDFEADAQFVFMPVDVDRWNPEIEIPDRYVYQRRSKGSVLIYHGVGSHVIGGRGNIKGTTWIRQAIDELQHEGYAAELMYVEGCPHAEIRFLQAQADIVVDQLLVGGGGANARECLALGKPVLTRVHPQQHEPFRRAAAPHGPPPFVETDRHNIKENLRLLIEDPDLRSRIGYESAEFARRVLAPVESASRFLRHYEAAARRSA